MTVQKLDKHLLFKFVRTMPMEMISDAVINSRKFKRLTVTRVRDARILFNVLCYKNICFEIMNWKYEFIDISLILTINYDIRILTQKN